VTTLRQQPKTSRPLSEKITHGTSARNLTETTMVSVYVLALLVVLLVIYLFYAVINPQKF